MLLESEGRPAHLFSGNREIVSENTKNLKKLIYMKFYQEVPETKSNKQKVKFEMVRGKILNVLKPRTHV